MLDVKMEKNELVFRIPQGTVDSDYLERLVNYIKLNQIVEKSEMTSDEAWELSETIKADWWEKNKREYLKGIYDFDKDNN